MNDEMQRTGSARLRGKVVADLLVWSACGFLAFVLRVPNGWWELGSVIAMYLVVSLPVLFAAIVVFKLHRRAWRRFAIEDVRDLAEAVGAGTAVLFVSGLAWYWSGTEFPRTVPLIEGVLAIVAMSAVRLSRRARKERDWRKRNTISAERTQRVLLVGAGEAGTLIGHEIRRRAGSGMEAVGFLDDGPAQAELEFAGMKVLGRIEDLPDVVADQRIDEVLIAIPSAPGQLVRRIVALADEAGVPCRILPGITEVLSGAATLAGVRSVQVEDILRREPIELDLSASYIEGRTVLVTGAGGSIGSELVRQVSLLDPAEVILLGHSENSLHDMGRELDRSRPALRATLVIGDVRDRAKIEYVMDKHEPSVVFHAAAHKHVPLLEADPDEAVLNNVAGTKNVVEMALLAGVKSFVNVSSDKAVRPTSILGATKWIGELVVRLTAADAEPGQSFVSVRFGNVLGSRGSVVPAFQDQIRRGGPITVTDPRMTRYFMTIPEASRLVMRAGSLGENGAVYVLNMGTPVPIVDLARDMIRLAGAGDDEIQIEFTGRRPGEKLHEELFTDAELLHATRYEEIVVAREVADPDLHVMDDIDALIEAAEERDWARIGPVP